MNLGKAFTKLSGILGGKGDGANADRFDENQITTMVNLSQLTGFVSNSFRFSGLPESLDQNLLWQLLCTYSTCVVFYNHKMNVFETMAYKVDSKNRNMNRNFYPPKVTAMDFLGGKYTVVTEGGLTSNDIKKGNDLGTVMYFSNSSRFVVDFHITLQYYARKMSMIDRAIDVRRQYHKVPVMFGGDEKDKSTFEAMFTGIEENKTFFVNTADFMSSITMNPMDFNYINDKLYQEKQMYRNEFLNQFGINNNQQEDKKERLITSEVDANDEQLRINRQNVLNSLQDFCDRFNRSFEKQLNGQKVSVHYIKDADVYEDTVSEELDYETNL